MDAGGAEWALDLVDGFLDRWEEPHELEEEGEESEESEEDEETGSTFHPQDDRGDIRPVYVLEYDSLERLRVRRASELDAAGPIKSCSVGGDHVALVAVRGGGLLCRGGNSDGQLGVGDEAPREGLCVTAPPRRASAVGAAQGVTVALRDDGRVFSCGDEGLIGRGGDCTVPAEVGGLPPVALLATAADCAVVISTGDDAFVWGTRQSLYSWWPGDPEQPRPMRLAAFSGLGIRRLALGPETVAETKQGELLLWEGGVRCLIREFAHPSTGGAEQQPARLKPPHMRFPLRSLVIDGWGQVYAADGAGTVWSFPCASDNSAVNRRLPRRAVQLAGMRNDLVALTEEGGLWTGTDHYNSWRPIRVARSDRPLGLLPYGGPQATQVVLAPDYSGGLERLRVFARIAVRVGVPCDPLREVLVPFVVHEVYLTGPSTDPFGDSVARD
eukprot:TRINITY_DN39342_c0_g1_i1.p1 TRINITY_DN39342_c0_g1~~TRINITY_DN39342_c0_g1_i1.p1  ORF type:complete len:469 (+),score=89.29 TRINITY_DN39342_c0_g1_i1:82-1407(+)